RNLHPLPTRRSSDLEDYTKEDLDKIPADADKEIVAARNIAYNLTARGVVGDYLKDYESYLDSQLKYNLNPDFNGRTTGDDIFDIDRKSTRLNSSHVK